MKKILSILAFLTMSFGMHSTCSAQEQTQTTSPKDDSQVQGKFATQILHSYSMGDFWYLEQLCDEKADSICDPLLAWGRGMAAARLFQLDEAKKQLGKFVYDYRDQMPTSWTLYAGDVLSSSLWWLQEYDEAAKVMDIALQVISEEGIADKNQGIIERFTDDRDKCLEFAKHPKMTLTRSENDIRIPFRISTFGKGRSKSRFMTIDGTLQGKSVNMVYDTGAGMSLITKELAGELNLKPINASVGINSSKITEATFVMADSLTMGNVTLRNVVFAMLDEDNEQLSQMFSIVIGLPVMLQMQQFTMDFKKNVITSPSQLTDYPSKNLTFHTEGGNFDVRICHNDSPIDIKVDTGNGHYSHLDYEFYTEHQEEIDRCREGSSTNMGAGGVYEMKIALVKKFDFTLNDKHYRFPYLFVMKDKMDAALGNNNMGLPFISSFKRVTISLKDAHIEFE